MIAAIDPNHHNLNIINRVHVMCKLRRSKGPQEPDSYYASRQVSPTQQTDIIHKHNNTLPGMTSFYHVLVNNDSPGSLEQPTKTWELKNTPRRGPIEL